MPVRERYVTNVYRCDAWGFVRPLRGDDDGVMWIALALPLLMLPALLAFSRFEQVMLTAPRVIGTPAPADTRDGEPAAGQRAVRAG